jgi:hypothetical protein
LTELSREGLVERLADVSHATWLLQSVRDYAKRLDDPTQPGPAHHRGTAEWKADCERAATLLKDVVEGGRLEELSKDTAHHATPHDHERAERTVEALETLGLTAAPGKKPA